jgi:uncharacterized protein YdiU (UPF0061 family)
MISETMTLNTLTFDNRFTANLPADPITENTRRQVHNACYSYVEPTKVSAPSLLAFSKEAAELLGLSEQDCQSEAFLQTFSGNQLLDGMKPYAMCYGGHQFGNWAGQLGDGRAINLGEVVNPQGDYWAIQLKGAGPTPYSRTADGLAVLRSSVREFVCSEAMHHLGVPTTRALSLINSGEQVMRDILYNGNAAYEPGTIVCRISPSFLRFGSFQLFASRNENDQLRQLVDVTIEQHFSELLNDHAVGSKELYLAWFDEVCQRTVKMIIGWMRVGFVHGVMNTDNMSILGLTIDYGPYGWLDDFNPEWTPNTTDSQNRRYRYGEQANIALWNCYQLANSIYPLLKETEPLEAILNNFQQSYDQQWLEMMASKLGLLDLQEGDQVLFERLEKLLAQVETDMTIFYRCLAEDDLSIDNVRAAYYQDTHDEQYQSEMTSWLKDYAERRAQDKRDSDTRIKAMNSVNPLYVFRNYLAQEAIDKAEAGDQSMVNELLEVLRNPYQPQQGKEAFAEKRPEWARSKVGCSMLSCSS